MALASQTLFRCASCFKPSFMERVIEIEWNPKWDGGAPMPQVFSNGQKVYLIYYIADWEKESVNKINTFSTSTGEGQLIALVEFTGNTFRFGIANDEVFSGLPLYEQGLNKWAHIIENSAWIEEIKNINKVHQRFNILQWANKNHYVLLFKDEILEVIARSYKIDVYKTTYKEIGLEVLTRMNN
jgi:hypothetical protein